MRRLRTTSTARLLAIVGCVGVLAATAAIAQGALTGSGPVPAPKALAQAIKSALGAPAPEGVTARIHFTNNLLPSGSLPGTSSALTSGADGRLWLTKEGKLRLELQSQSGDAQLTSDGKRITLFDSLLEHDLPRDAARGAGGRREARGQAREPDDREDPGGAEPPREVLDRVGRGADLDRRPADLHREDRAEGRRRPARRRQGRMGRRHRRAAARRGLRAGPVEPGARARGDGHLLRQGRRLRRQRRPRRRTRRSSISARRRRTRSAAGKAHDRSHEQVSGVDAVAKQLDFALAAPDKLAGLPRQDAQLVDVDKHTGAIVTYGKGLGAIVVFQHKTDTSAADDKNQAAGGRDRNPLPQINIDGTTGTEIPTALGTIVTFERGGVSYVVAGSVPPLAAENAARGLK